MLDEVDDGRLAGLLAGVMFTRLVAEEGPQILDINGWAIMLQGVGLHVEVTHANLSEVTRVAV